MSANLEFKIVVDEKAGVAGVGRFRQHVHSDLNVIRGDFGKAGVAIRQEMDDVAQSLLANTGAVGRLASSFGVAGIAIGATAGIAAGATAAILKTTNAAADAGERFDDLAGKTGLNIETLSGLELQLKQSETSLEGFANGMFFLTKNQAAAREGNDELAAAFRRLGVDLSAGPEEAIRQTVKGLSELTDVGERNRLGAQVMGRAYKELAIFINDAEGDLDKLIETSRKAGRVMTEEAARAAAQYKDNLDELNAQIDAVERNLGSDFLPAVSRVMKNVAELLKGNAGDWRQWALSVKDAFEILNPGARGMGGETLAWLFGGLPAAEAVARARAAQAQLVPTDVQKFGEGKRGGVNVPEELQYKPKISDADLMRAAKERFERDREKAEQDAARRRERARQEETRAIEAAAKAREDVWRKHVGIQEDVLRESQRQLEASQKAHAENILEDRRRVIDASEAVQAAIAEEINALTGVNEHLEEIERTITRATILGAIDSQTAAWLRLLAVVNETAEQIPNLRPVMPGDIPQVPGQEGGPLVTEDVGPPPELFTRWQEFGMTVQDALEQISTSSFNAGQMVGGLFQGMAQGMSQSIQAWLLYGGSIGKMVKQALASVLASLAAEAAVKAIFQLAEGFAMLFLHPAKAAAHFKAAALYGAAAVAAGVGARAFAGGAATAAAGYAGGGGGAFDTGSSAGYEDFRTKYLREQAEKDKTTRREDRRGESSVVQLIVDGRELGRAVLNHVRDGGDLRDGFRNAVGGAY